MAPHKAQMMLLRAKTQLLESQQRAMRVRRKPTTMQTAQTSNARANLLVRVDHAFAILCWRSHTHLSFAQSPNVFVLFASHMQSFLQCKVPPFGHVHRLHARWSGSWGPSLDRRIVPHCVRDGRGHAAAERCGNRVGTTRSVTGIPRLLAKSGARGSVWRQCRLCGVVTLTCACVRMDVTLTHVLCILVRAEGPVSY
jgi:hypothetical protein